MLEKKKCIGKNGTRGQWITCVSDTESSCNKRETPVFEISGLKLHIVLIKLKKTYQYRYTIETIQYRSICSFLLFPGDFSRDVFDGFSSRTDVEIKPMVPKRCICLQGSCDCCFDKS